jgi:hypothetical protein
MHHSAVSAGKSPHSGCVFVVGCNVKHASVACGPAVPGLCFTWVVGGGVFRPVAWAGYEIRGQDGGIRFKEARLPPG